ncbi:MAG: hypothetical protein Q9211_000048 [Gyalolechia sp. 1 TL-2023]
MAAVTLAPGLPVSRADSDSETLSTLPDPRSSLTLPELSQTKTTSPQHPDLSNEVATLSNKLIRAINHQTDLDDTLVGTRHELNEAQRRVKLLEVAAAEHDALLASGELVRRSEVERQKVELLDNLAREQQQRGVMEKDKRGMEQELESLTTALFEEANQMVAAARKDREAADRRSDQLRSQLNETELLLVSHQEQLAQLKAVMHQMSLDREHSDINAAASTAPSTPALQTQETMMNRIDDALNSSPSSADVEAAVPAPPTSFTHLLHPVLRTDLPAYDDFQTLLSSSRKSSPTSRVSSGSFSNLNLTNLSHLGGKETQHSTTRFPSTGSNSSLSTSTTYSSSPTAPSSTTSSVSSRDAPLNGVALKETRFYKRALTEDIEPTLRLDTAPGLSWLARRTVVNSMSEGSLVVEPMPATIKRNVFACSLCGENRRAEKYARSHRFRTNENGNAQRYPLCHFCLSRLRASCDFLGFLRILKDGHWRANDEDAELQAWEECVRLRERMFWARMGGGVVPAFSRTRETPRDSVEQCRNIPAGANDGLKKIDDEANTVLYDTRMAYPVDQAGCSADLDKLHLGHDDTKSDATIQLPALPAVVGSQAAAPEQLQNNPTGVQAEAPQGLGIGNHPLEGPRNGTRDSITMPGAFE